MNESRRLEGSARASSPAVLRSRVSLFPDRRGKWTFALGCALVTAGVGLHLPGFVEARAMHYRLAGMPMGPTMTTGMVMILLGFFLAAFGLVPRRVRTAAPVRLEIAAPEDAPLSMVHGGVMLALTAALVIDTMKPAALGFVTPGMMAEYRIGAAEAAWLPFSALAGTVAGSWAWGVFADACGRRAGILIAAAGFAGTSICGAMPSFSWNVLMCFLMGAAAGGMLPIAYALLSEIMPTRHRSWSLVLVGGVGMSAGYLAASGLSALLQPIFGWRIMWLLNLPTGLALIALQGAIPESPRFLLRRGHVGPALAVLSRFGLQWREGSAASPLASATGVTGAAHPGRLDLGGAGALTLAAFSWGLVNFGLLLWLPADLSGRGASMAQVGGMLSMSALLALPVVIASSALYGLASAKWGLIAMIAATTAGALALALQEAGKGSGFLSTPLLPAALLIIGANGMLAMLLPYTVESNALIVRGRTSGWVAGCSKLGGLGAQGLSLLALAPALGLASALIAIPLAVSGVLVATFGRETRGRDLRTLEAAEAG